MPSETTRCGGVACNELPAKRIDSAVESMRRKIAFSVELFPAQFATLSPRLSPSATEKLTPETA